MNYKGVVIHHRISYRSDTIIEDILYLSDFIHFIGIPF